MIEVAKIFQALQINICNYIVIACWHCFLVGVDGHTNYCKDNLELNSKIVIQENNPFLVYNFEASFLSSFVLEEFHIHASR